MFALPNLPDDAPGSRSEATGTAAGPSPLSERETQTLQLIARGFSFGEIARLQRVSVHTTRTHAKNIYAKLDVHSKNEAVFEAASQGLLPTVFARLPYHPTQPHERPTGHPEPGHRAADLFGRA